MARGDDNVAVPDPVVEDGVAATALQGERPKKKKKKKKKDNHFTFALE